MMQIVLIATCQVQSLELLAQNMLAEARVYAIDAHDHAFYRPAAQSLASEKLATADFIFVQQGAPEPYALEGLKQRYPGRVFSLAFPVFRGLHPDGCYVGAVGDKFQDPSLYHSLAVLEAYRTQKPQAWAERNALSDENFDRLGLFAAWDESLDDLREKDKEVDFPIAPLIEEYCREYPGFLTINHPSLALLHRYMMGVLKWLGLPAKPVDLSALRDPLAHYDVVPVYDFVAERYGLSFRTTQNWMIEHMGKRFIPPQEIVRRFYEAYTKVEAEKLAVSSPPDLCAKLAAAPSLSFLLRKREGA